MPLTKPSLDLINLSDSLGSYVADMSGELIVKNSQVYLESLSEVVTQTQVTAMSFDSSGGILTITLIDGTILKVDGFPTESKIPEGEKGLSGFPGPPGKIGKDGEYGAQGEPGCQGVPGPEGNRGEKGPTGLIGDSGPVGNSGNRGPRGAKGEIGDRGDKGPQGAAGKDGADGQLGIANIIISSIDPAVLGLSSPSMLWVNANSIYVPFTTTPPPPTTTTTTTTPRPTTTTTTTTPRPTTTTTTTTTTTLPKCPENYYLKKDANGEWKCVCRCIDDTYVGFTASTGGQSAKQEILSFSFSNNYTSINAPIYGISAASWNTGGSAVISNGVSVLTEDVKSSGGNIWLKKPVRFVDNYTNVGDFNVSYSVRITCSSEYNKADGIAFVIQSESSGAGGVGGGMGYAGITKSIAIILDVFTNSYDVNNNHIELDVNGDVSTPLVNAVLPFQLHAVYPNTRIISVWITYINKLLNVYVSDRVGVKPTIPNLTYNGDLSQYFTFITGECSNCPP